MRAAWLSLWLRLAAQGDPDEIFRDLVARYAGRAYHNISHIECCLLELHLESDPVEFALWFHDAVYDSTSKDNEEQSAALAQSVAREAGLSKDFGAQVVELILATRHDAPPMNPDEQLIVDIDLSILGSSPARFAEYERQIREEYAWVPGDAFALGRSALLESLLARPRIYSTDHFHARYEQQARENLFRSITALRSRSQSPLSV